MNALLGDWREPLREITAEGVHRVENIVVPLDGSAASKSALPVARTLAKLEGATLHVVYVGEKLLGPQQTLAELGLSAEEVQGVVVDQLTGDPAEAILSFSNGLPASLLVMATHTGAQRARATLGSVAEAVLSDAPYRIVLVSSAHDERAWHVRRIVLAHDGTPTSDPATGPAARLAQRAGAEVIALHVATRKGSHRMEPGSLPAPRYIDQPQHEWPAWASEFMDRMMALGAPPAAVNFKLLVTRGQPGSEIAQFARDHDADLVVLGWTGHWRAHGPSALKVALRRSGCPVLLVRALSQPRTG